MKVYMILSGLGLGATLLVAALFLRYEAPNSKLNGFERRFIESPITKRLQKELPDEGYYYAGSNTNHIYLSHYRRNTEVMQIPYGNVETNRFFLRIDSAENYRFFHLRINISMPYFYLSDGTIPRTFRGTLSEGIARPFMPNKSFFIRQQPVSATRFINRLLLDSLTGQVLATETSDGALDIKRDLLQKQLDGQFCVEGTMHYDSSTGIFVYVYAYRNGFFTTDSLLNLQGRYPTIDTNTRIQFNVATIRSENQHTLSSPPFTVNAASSADKGLLYVHSALKADNERITLYRDQSAVDVYLLKTGAYLGSFYLPLKKIKQFRVTGNRLIVLSDRQLLVYEIDSNTCYKDFLHVETGRQTEHL